MKFFNIIHLLFFNILVIAIYAQNSSVSVFPVNLNPDLAGNFGELRSSHLHTGIDIRTGGKEGLPVFCIDSGYVSRIKIELYGYGKTLYINHPNGITSVYAHLSKFNSEIDKYVLQKQLELKSRNIDINVPVNTIIVLKGDICAYSGNSGASMGPHLHFELRNTKTETLLNPENYGLRIKDSFKPEIEYLILYELSTNTAPIKVLNKKIIYNKNTLINTKSKFIALGAKIKEKGRRGGFNLGINSVQLFSDSSLVYHLQLDSFPFYQKQFVNQIIDYKEYISENIKNYKFFTEGNNNFYGYKSIIKNGIISIPDSGITKIKLLINDITANTDSFTLRVSSNTRYENSNMNTPYQKSNSLFVYNQTNYLKENETEILANEYTFDGVLYFTYSDTIINNIRQLQIGDEEIPLFKEITVSILAKELHLPEKSVLVKANKAVETNLINNKLVSNIRSLGKYEIHIDTIPPRITKLNSGRYRIKDNLSGIKELNLYINNSLCDYSFDYRTSTLKLTKQIKKGDKIKIICRDKKGNEQKLNTIY